MAKAIIVEEQQWCYLTHNGENKGAHTFLEDISPKGYVIVRLESGLVNDIMTYYIKINFYTTFFVK